MSCPCCSGQSYEACCAPYLEGRATAPTPEALMRSRYTAFTKADTDYIGRTQAQKAARHYDAEKTKAWCQACDWQSLQVTDAPPPAGDKGQVAFVATYLESGTERHIIENSLFACIDKQWYYVSGTHKTTSAPKVGRNDPCACGSGRKYKKCCGA